MEAVQMALEAEQMYNMEEPVENVCKEHNLLDGADVVVVLEQHHCNNDEMEQDQYAAGRQNQLLHAGRLQVVLDCQQQWMQEEAIHKQHFVAE